MTQSHFIPCDGCNSSFSSDKSIERAQELMADAHAMSGCKGKPQRDSRDAASKPIRRKR
jgi:hypothetical protein